ncbi:MAG: T9SS type B sorting domain-containing protein, partial [Chitinophagaceae bacterium]
IVGCDSIATLHLIVNPNVTGQQTITICQGQLPYTWNNQNITAAGNYNATLISAAGCDSVATLHLLINPVVTGEETVTICQGQLPYTWNNQNISNAGDYNTTLLNIVGCDSVATLHLIVNPNVTGQQTITICQAQLPYSWNEQTIIAAGDYNAALISAAGCDSIAMLHLIVIPQPKIITTDVSLCSTANLTDPTVTSGSDLELAFTYWLDAGATNPVPDPTSVLTGSYYIKGINASGCFSIKPVIVTIEPSPLFITTNPAKVCEPETVDLTDAAITAGSDSRLSFTYWNDEATTSPLVNPQSIPVSGTYYIRAAAAGGCSFVKSAEVLVTTIKGEKSVRYPTVTISPNTPVQLDAREPGLVNSYTWNPPVGLNAPDRKDPIFHHDEDMEYTIRIEYDNQCPVVDTVLVLIRQVTSICVSDIFVPKAWSPNNDGHNDKLYPISVCIRELKYFRVFNRWGQLVFQTNIPGQGWDGIFNGIPQVMDTYTWTLEATGEDGKYFKRVGNSVLVR